MKHRKRKGFALIYTVLIGALVLMSIVGLTIKAIPENAITKARTHSQRALSVAETGASQVLFDLRNFSNNKFDPDSNSVEHYLTVSYIMTLIDSSAGDILSFGKSASQSDAGDSFNAAYEAKIKVNNNYLDPDNDNKPTLDVDLFVLGTVTDKTTDKTLARDAIKTSFKVTYNIEPYTEQIETKTWVSGTPSGIFDYALYSGEDIIFGGSAQTVVGDIHAVGQIDLGNAKNQVRVGGGGDAESERNIVGKGVVTGSSIPNAPPVPFPEIDIDTYAALADSFRSGTAPYDGTTPNYPNVSSPIVLAVIQSYLGAPGSSSNLEGINNFYHDLMDGTGGFVALTPAQINDLRANAKSIVYYVEGDVHINGQFECVGTLVIDGDLVINGNSQIGDPNNPGASAILVKGDIIRSNGNADLYGLFYSTGSLIGSGTFYCEGSIATKGSIKVTGNYTVDYHEITNPNLSVSTPGHWDITYTPGEPQTYYSITSAAGYGSAGQDDNAIYLWEEVSFDDFEGLH